MPSLTYQSDYIPLVEQGNQIKFDPDGYADITVGALNAFNSAGAYYTYEEAKKVFEASEHFMRRVREGTLYGEYGHPKRQPNMTDKEYLVRILTIEEKSYSHHFKDITLIENGAKNRDGTPVVVIQARLKPFGPYGQYVGESLENRHQNTAFSIRSITDDYYDPIKRCIVKIIRNAVTFDLVTEPGIYNANKYRTIMNNPSNEDYSLKFDRTTVQGALHDVRSNALGLESSSLNDSLESMLGHLSSNVERRPSGLIVPKAKKPFSASW